MDRPVRIGVVGCGFIGERHVEAAAASELLEPVAVADVRVEVAQAVAGQFAVPACHPDAHALLRDAAVEAVVLAIPTSGRAELAVAALRAGKHVLLEKPPAMRCTELERIAHARAPELVVASCSSRFRHSPAARAAADAVRTGVLGGIRVVRMLGTRPVPPEPSEPAPAWRLSTALNGGGVLANWGSYDLDYAFGITGWELEPATVFARLYGIAPPLSSYVAPESDAETHAIVVVGCRGGETLVLQRSEYVATVEEDEVCIVGELGVLRWSLRSAVEKTIVHEALDRERGVLSAVAWKGADDFGIERMQRAVLEDFARAVRGPRDPATSLERAFVVQSVLDAAYASARTGQATAVRSLRGGKRRLDPMRG